MKRRDLKTEGSYRKNKKEAQRHSRRESGFSRQESTFTLEDSEVYSISGHSLTDISEEEYNEDESVLVTSPLVMNKETKVSFLE